MSEEKKPYDLKERLLLFGKQMLEILIFSFGIFFFGFYFGFGILKLGFLPKITQILLIKN